MYACTLVYRYTSYFSFHDSFLVFYILLHMPLIICRRMFSLFFGFAFSPPSFMFGGAGTLAGGIRPILSEFWQYVPTSGVWVPLNALPVNNALAPPVGRYGTQ